MNKEDLEVDSTVHLRPNTRTASAECHRRLAATVVSTDDWPLVLVRVEGNREIRVHNRDVGKKPRQAAKKDRVEGDTQQGHDTTDSTRKSAAFTAHKPLVLPDNMEEQTLW